MLKTQEAANIYRAALAALRQALAAEEDALQDEIVSFEEIEGCLSDDEDERYDAALDRVIDVSNQLSGLYH